MKIVFMSSAFYPSIGGVETHAVAVARELVARGHKVTVITEDASLNKHSKSKSDNTANISKSADKSTQFIRKRLDQISIYYFKYGQKGFFKKFRIWYYLFKNRNLFSDADVIHAHDVFIWYLPLRFFFWNKKIFTTFHGHETVFPPEEKAKLIRKISEKLSRGNIIVGKYIEKWYGTFPGAVTYGGVYKIKDSNLRIKNFKRGRKINLLLVGRLEKDIGIQVYKETLRKLSEKGVNFTFTVCGEGSLGQGLEQYGEVLGFVRDVTTYIRHADIVFASSYLSMLQALQLGTPVFASYSNPLKHDYLRNSPFEKHVIISDSAEDLARKVSKFTPNIQKLTEGAKWANSQTWSRVTDLYIQLWEKK